MKKFTLGLFIVVVGAFWIHYGLGLIAIGVVCSLSGYIEYAEEQGEAKR